MPKKGVAEYLRIGERIKKLRQAAGYTQKGFAGLLNIPVSTYSNYENGNREPRMSVLNEIAKKLNVPLSEIVSFSPELEDIMKPENRELLHKMALEFAISDDALFRMFCNSGTDAEISGKLSKLAGLLKAHESRKESESLPQNIPLKAVYSIDNAPTENGAFFIPLTNLQELNEIIQEKPDSDPGKMRFIDAPNDTAYSRDHMIAIRVEDDSMAPFLLDGDIAIVCLDLEVSSGSIALAVYHEEMYLRRIVAQDDGVILQPANSFYPAIFIPEQESKDNGALGRVIELRRTWHDSDGIQPKIRPIAAAQEISGLTRKEE